MAFVPWKDRVTSTPHRYKLTEVSADTYDLEAVPGSISEAGIPVNAENLNKLIQRDGDDIKDTVVAFTEASSRANIGTGESTATLFGKIKKYFTDLKAHAFTTPSATQSTSADTVPSSNLLKESSFARVIRAVTELGLSYPCTTTDILNALYNGTYINTVVLIGLSTAASASITDLPSNYGTLLIHLGSERLRWLVEYSTEIGDGSTVRYLGRISRSGNTVIGVTWEKIKTGNAVSLGGASATVNKYHRFASVSFTGTYTDVSGIFLVTDNNGINYINNTAIFTLRCITNGTGLANTARVECIGGDAALLTSFYVKYTSVTSSPNQFDFYYFQDNAYKSIYVEFLSSTTRNNVSTLNPPQKYFDLITPSDSERFDSITGTGYTVATFTDKLTYSTVDVQSAQTISGVKTFSASPLVPTTPSGASAAVAKSYVTAPPDNITMTKTNPVYSLKNTAITVGTLPDVDTYNSAIQWTDNANNNCSYIQYAYRQSGAVTSKWVINSHNQPNVRETGVALEQTKGVTAADDLHRFYPISNTDCDLGTSANKWKDIHFSGALKKNGTEVFPSPYDKVIRTQAEFEQLIASATWLDAKSVALVGQFTLSTANNSGIKIPATVKQIHGFNSAKITVTNFAYDSSTAKGGLWYVTRPTTPDYSIRDLEVDCTGTGSLIRAFYNCIGLHNCTGTGTGGTDGFGFRNCTNLTNCTGTGTGTGGGLGFDNCDYITNCTGTGTGGNGGYGFYNCDNLSNCTGKGEDSGDQSEGYGFSNITRASNCKDGGSDTDMWGGTNKNIDLETCRKTPVTANNATLNT